MEEIRHYLFSVLCTALICSVLKDLSEHTFFKKQIHLVCGLFLAYAFLHPLIAGQLPQFDDPWEHYLAEAKAASARGEEISAQAMRQIITQESEAYILEKANSIGADITLTLELSNDQPPIPVSAVICGEFDADSESALAQILEQDLGIPKEHQTWIRQESGLSDSSSENTNMFF